MRDHNVNEQILLTRQKRQAFAVAIAMATGSALMAVSATSNSAMAADPVQIAARVPLPLTATTPKAMPTVVGSDAFKINPFCLPDEPSLADNIRLASGSSTSPVRLMPIGKAIGLQAITDGQPRCVDKTAMTVEVPQPNPVQENPLVELVSGEAAGESDSTSVEVDQPQAASVFESRPQASSIILLPMKRSFTHVAQEVPPAEIESIPAESFVRPPTVVEPVAVEPMVIEPVVIAQPQAPEPQVIEQGVDLVSDENIDEEPITFSFTDSSSDELVAVSDSQAPHSQGTEELVESHTNRPAPFGSVEPLSLDAVEDARPMGEDAAPRTNEFCVDEMQPSTVAELIAPQEVDLHTRRYRPPVAVHAVPIAIQGAVEAPEFRVQSAIDSGGELNKTTSERLAENAVVTPLYLNRTQVRSLTLGAQLRGVEIANKDVCQAFAAGPNQLKLIGTGKGVTRLVVWAEPVAGETSPRVKAFDIHVKDAVETSGTPTGDRITLLNQSIIKAFPDADVVVRQSQQKLMVIGRCGSEATAKKIIRMVRKSCLTPVEDQLRVR